MESEESQSRDEGMGHLTMCSPRAKQSNNLSNYINPALYLKLDLNTIYNQIILLFQCETIFSTTHENKNKFATKTK